MVYRAGSAMTSSIKCTVLVCSNENNCLQVSVMHKYTDSSPELASRSDWVSRASLWNKLLLFLSQGPVMQLDWPGTL